MRKKKTEGFGSLFEQRHEHDRLIFTSLGSGSSGNCYLLSYNGESIILDAGIGIRKTLKELKPIGIDTAKIRAIFLTHDHADHIRGAMRLAYKLGIPIHCTNTVARSLLYRRCSSPDLSAYLKILPPNDMAVNIGAFNITYFRVPHDARENVGYKIETPLGCFVLITDIGRITEDITQAIRSANYLIFESNYDDEMLRRGSYPYHLKVRIASGEGHLSNRIAAQTLADNYHEELKFIGLCHLSAENNHPDLAYNTLLDALNSNCVPYNPDLEIHILDRYTPGIYTLPLW